MILLHVKFYFIIILLFLISCSENKIVNNLISYNGVYEITRENDNYITFTANLKEYNNIMVMCFINCSGELIKVYPIDKYNNVDVSMEYIKLLESNGLLHLLYENRDTYIIIESFNGLTLYKKTFLKRDPKSYGSLIQIGQSGNSKYVKSSLYNDSTTHKSYYYNYFILDDNLNLLKSGSLDLDEYYPRGMLLQNGNVFYYLNDRDLVFKPLAGGKETSVYNFDSNIIQLKKFNDTILVLLSDSIYMVTEDGKISKGFNLLQEGSNYTAVSILTSENEFIVVQLTSEKGSIYKIFSSFGSQIKEYSVNDVCIGGSYIFDSLQGQKLLYSNKSNLYLNTF